MVKVEGFLVGRQPSMASVRHPMTRFLALSFAVFAFAFTACEKHPLPGETAVTTVPGIDGVSAGHGDDHAKKDDHPAPAAGEAKH